MRERDRDGETEGNRDTVRNRQIGKGEMKGGRVERKEEREIINE